MIRRILDFVAILLFVWISMLTGLWAIATLIVPLRLPGVENGGLTNIVQVLISTIMVLAWLLIWRWLATSMFWRLLRESTNLKNAFQDKGRGEIET